MSLPYAVKQLEAIPPQSNPFHHDWYHMGVKLGTNLYIMMENHDTQTCHYLILVNLETGERHRLQIKEKEATCSSD